MKVKGYHSKVLSNIVSVKHIQLTTGYVQYCGSLHYWL